MLLAVTAMVGGLGYLVVDRADQFLADWPRYSAILRHVTTAFDRQMSTVEKQVEAIAPATEERGATPVRAAEPPPVREWLFRGVGSLYSILLVATFVPFLVFFMLAAKRRIWKATMELFPDEHQDARERGARSSQLHASELCCRQCPGGADPDAFELGFFPGDSPGLSFSDRQRLGPAESGAVPRRGPGVDTAVFDRHGAVEHDRSLHWGCGHADAFSHSSA